MKGPGIILFGKKIGLLETAPAMEKTTSSDAIALLKPHDQRKEESDDEPEAISMDEEGASETPQTTDRDPINLHTRTLRKPDKILPCPRCDSMNTKFCYFNNSNVNQPRHFCKSCQRYWTAGGTMRNMPVGAGRRKKKTPPSHCRYIISQDAFESEAAATAAKHIEFARDSDGIPPKVLSFGPNSPHFVAGVSGKESRDDCASSSVVDNIQENNGFHSHFHWIQGASWPYNPWNTPTPIPMPIPMPIPPIYPPTYPQIPMYSPPYWSSISWLPHTNSILRKHPTDGETIKPDGCHEEFKKQRKSILVPKTLGIDDPDEAAKSSIWATLGIKNEHSGRGDLFKAFQSKGNDKKKNKASEPSPVLQANPAALSRSLSFQERA